MDIFNRDDRMRPGLSLVMVPHKAARPIQELARRVALALGLVIFTTCVVFFDRHAYSDANGKELSLIDCFYYATVTVTTTGYGDIVPVAQHARLLNALILTPARIGFIVLLVGTTLEVLASEGRRILKDASWRRHMRQHTVVIGYGTKGHSAVRTLIKHGRKRERIVVIDSQQRAISRANSEGVAGFVGDGSRREMLRQAEITKASDVIITVDRDDLAILTTLTVRQLNATASIVVAIREEENARLVRQSGATSVITSADTVGRLMGLSTIGPHLGAMIQDLLSVGEGLEVDQRLAMPNEVGMSSSSIPGERVIGIIRNDTLRRFYEPTASKIEAGDQLITVRKGRGDPKDRLPNLDDE